MQSVCCMLQECVLQNKLTRAQYLDEVTWTTKNWLGLQKQRISVVLHTAIAEQVVKMSLPVAGAGGCTELSASPPSQESLRRLPWCTCASASARQSRAQCKKKEIISKPLLRLPRQPRKNERLGRVADDAAHAAGYADK